MSLSGITYNNILGGSSSYTWAQTSSITTSTRFTNINGTSLLELPSDGNAVKINGELIINEENIDDRLKRIEDLLHIPQRDVIMERKYNKLKQLWQEYTETLEAIKTWETVKESK